MALLVNKLYILDTRAYSLQQDLPELTNHAAALQRYASII